MWVEAKSRSKGKAFPPLILAASGKSSNHFAHSSAPARTQKLESQNQVLKIPFWSSEKSLEEKTVVDIDGENLPPECDAIAMPANLVATPTSTASSKRIKKRRIAALNNGAVGKQSANALSIKSLKACVFLPQ